MSLLSSILSVTLPFRSRAESDTQSPGNDTDLDEPSSESASSARQPHPRLSSNTAITASTLTAAATILAACGGKDGTTSSEADAYIAPSYAAQSAATGASTNLDNETVRFLHQAQFSAVNTEIKAVKAQGYAAWLQAQYAAPISQTGWQWLDSRGYGVVDPSLKFFKLAWADNMMWNQLATAPDAVRKRMALALSEFFVVSTSAFDGYWPSYIMASYWDLLNTHAFGNFRDLLEAVTLSPAMGRYLNTKGNHKQDSNGREPDENYAREILQLFSIGLCKLNKDGTLVLDNAGAPIPTYGQSDISNLARVFTGYDYDTRTTVYTPLLVSGFVYQVPTRDFCKLPMAFSSVNHSTLEATFLGVTIPAGTDGPAALKIALDTIFQHPNTGPFFARQMIQRLVTSNPSPAYVGRVAAAFAGTTTTPRGDLKAVWTAILTDPEALTVATSTTGGKLREPMIRLLQLCRTVGVKSTNGNWDMYDLSSDMSGIGQSPLRAPSVFNFFRPGYVPPVAALANAGLVAPEFQIVNETTVAEYLNFMMRFLKYGRNDVWPDFTILMSQSIDNAGLLAWLNLCFCANQLSANTLAVIKQGLDASPAVATSTNAKKIDVIQSAIFMVMASPEYLVLK